MAFFPKTETVSWGLAINEWPPNNSGTISDGTCFKENFDYYGNDVKLLYASNSSSCQMECQINEDCKFWTYNTLSNGRDLNCWLKSSDSFTSMKSNRISGPKYCGNYYLTKTYLIYSFGIGISQYIGLADEANVCLIRMAQIIWSTRRLVRVLLDIQSNFYWISSRAIFLLLLVNV